MTTRAGSVATGLRALLRLSGLGIVAGILAGHLGALHPALDSFAHLRVQFWMLAAAAGVALLLANLRVLGLVMLGVAAMSFAATAPYLRTPWSEERSLSPGDVAGRIPFVALQQNFRYDNPNADAFVDRVRATMPEVIALQEVRAPALAAIEVLAERYPHMHRCRGASAAGDVVLLSRRPFVGPRRCAPGLAIASIELGGTRVGLGSLHLHWPWPFGQAEHIGTLAPHVPRIGAPGLLLGDFNAVPWSDAVARIAAMMDGAPVRGFGGTRVDPDLPAWLRPLWDIPIDQMIATPDVEPVWTRSLPLTGSDHDTLIAAFLVAPTPPERSAALRAAPYRAATSYRAKLPSSEARAPQ